MQMIAVSTADGQEIRLSPGKHSELIKDILEHFGPRYVPGGKIVYVGDTGDKWGYFNAQALRCIFRSNLTTNSATNWTPIPRQSGHGFR